MNSSEMPDRRTLLSNALLALEQMQAKLTSAEERRREPIAIVGLSCRFPGGANDPEKFWASLREGRDLTREVPTDRWNLEAFYDPDPDAPGKMNARRAGFLDRIDEFDAHFFGISPREAVSIDPQQRLVLEVTWEALERAGYAPSRLKGSQTGVFMGIGSGDFASLLIGGDTTSIDAYAGSGGGNCFAAGRLSYLLGLQGPSLAVDTACSSSLVAVHLACQSLRNDECRLAVAGGVNVILSPVTFVFLSKAHALSPNGTCRAFDADADGFVRGEGCGVIVLKRLSDALQDGDRILAVIRGSSVNQDGASSGLTVPNGPAQQALVADAIQRAGVAPAEISYVETHGTGTPLGDPIEAGALISALGAGRSDDQPLVLGSVKTNIGHLEAAAGIAGLIKVVLSLEHEEIPPHLHFARLNDHISPGHVRLVIPTTSMPWPRGAARRVAGVSSFGLSGTNSHVVVEEAPVAPVPTSVVTERPAHPLTFAARDRTALGELAGLYADRIESGSLGDLCFTANVGRAAFSHRAALVTSSGADASRRLRAFAAGADGHGMVTGHVEPGYRPKVAFLFTGVGSEYASMGKELYGSQPTFRRAIDECDALLSARMPVRLRSLMFDAHSESALEATTYRPLALFALEFALARVWSAWGITPAVVTGQDVGEYVAATVAGVLSIDEALAMVAARAGRRSSERIAADFERAASRVDATSMDFISGDTVNSSLARVRQSGCDVWIEVGPSPALLSQARPVDAGASVHLISSLAHGNGEWMQMLNAVVAVYVAGGSVDFAAVEEGMIRRRVDLPTYPFQRERCWPNLRPVSPDAASVRTGTDESAHPLLARRLVSPLARAHFETTVRASDPAWVADHRVFGTPVFPFAAYAEMALVAAASAYGDGSRVLENMTVSRALQLNGDTPVSVQTIVGASSDPYQFRIVSTTNDGAVWHEHASGTVASRALDDARAESLEAIKQRCTQDVSVESFYARATEKGLAYGPAFQGVSWVGRGNGEALGHIKLAPEVSQVSYRVHPAALDACLQVLGSAVNDVDAVYLPVAIDRVSVHGRVTGELWSHAVCAATPGSDVATAQIRVYDAAGRLVIDVDGLRLKRASAVALRATDNVASWIHRIEWESASLVEPVQQAQGSWIVVAPAGDLANELAATLTARGHRCQLIDPFSAGDLERAVARPDGVRVDGIVHLHSVDVADGFDLSASSDMAHAYGSALRLLQHAAKTPTPPPIWIVTHGAQTLSRDLSPAVGQAAVMGLARTAVVESPGLVCRRVDLDPEASSFDSARELADELLQQGREDEVAWREGRRFVRRLVRHAALEAVRGSAPVRLVIPERGVLDRLVLQPAARQAPGPGEIELRVFSTGLNFRDVLNALGMYPGDAGPLGCECAGVVTAIGEGVSGLSVGDKVMALAGASFSTYVVTPAALAVGVPGNLTLDEAVTAPNAFLTAWYALEQCARLSPGERVLIHAAAGGVGLAAVQLARRAGAEVFATAGSDAKRSFLRELGVRYVFDSRSLAFADEIREATSGEGIDVVLNSLAGEFIPSSLSLLRSGGRFLEIGKTGIWTTEQVERARPGVSYAVIDIGQAIATELPVVRRILEQLTADLANGSLQPLPFEAFPLERVVDAFRHMAMARHIGKVVVNQPAALETVAASSIRQDSTYLVTGGLGALGLLGAQWLARQGARHIALVGRHQPTGRAAEIIETLRRDGIDVVVESADIGRIEDVQALGRALAARPPVRGILHAAGVLDDGLLSEQRWDRLEQVALPKVCGAIHLREQFRASLELFVSFSSAAALLGSAGQANYAAANACLDALTRRWRRDGLRAVTVNWGAWSVGMTATVDARHRDRWAAQGVAVIPEAAANDLFDATIWGDEPQPVVLAIDWAQFLRQQYAPGEEPPLYARLLDSSARPHARVERAVRSEALERMRSASPDERIDLMVAHVRGQVMAVLGLSEAKAPALRDGLTDLGMDSLMAMELRNRLQSSLEAKLPSTLAFEYPTIEALATFLIGELHWPDAPRLEARPVRRDAHDAALDRMSAEELEASLLAELDRAGY